MFPENCWRVTKIFAGWNSCRFFSLNKDPGFSHKKANRDKRTYKFTEKFFNVIRVDTSFALPFRGVCWHFSRSIIFPSETKNPLYVNRTVSNKKITSISNFEESGLRPCDVLIQCWFQFWLKGLDCSYREYFLKKGIHIDTM